MMRGLVLLSGWWIAGTLCVPPAFAPVVRGAEPPEREPSELPRADLPGPSAPAQPPVDATDLSLEVSALRTLHALKVTPAQLRTLAEWAKETVNPALPPRENGAASDAYRTLLEQARAALLDGGSERVVELCDRLDEVREEENPPIDDIVAVTPAARQRAFKAIHLFSAKQIASFYASYGESAPDPRELMQNALEKARDFEPEPALAFRDQLADEVAWLVGGVDEEHAEQVKLRVVIWFNLVREMRDREFKKNRAEAERAAEQIVENIGPLDVLRHLLERDLAELLSNPRLPAAIAARLENE